MTDQSPMDLPEDLGAYVRGELPADTLAAIDARCAQDPTWAAAVQEAAQLEEALHLAAQTPLVPPVANRSSGWSTAFRGAAIAAIAMIAVQLITPTPTADSPSFEITIGAGEQAERGADAAGYPANNDDTARTFTYGSVLHLALVPERADPRGYVLQVVLDGAVVYEAAHTAERAIVADLVFGEDLPIPVQGEHDLSVNLLPDAWPWQSPQAVAGLDVRFRWTDADL